MEHFDDSYIELTIEEKEYLKHKDTIIAHNEMNWTPFNYNEDGKAKGFSIDYMNLLISKIGINIEYLSGYSWDQFMGMLQTKQLDLIINIAKNPQRAKSIEFTEPFISVKNAIYVNKNKKSFNTLEELNGHTIAMPQNFFMQKYIQKNYPKIKQINPQDLVACMKLLSLGKVDAVIGKKIVVDKIIEEYLISNILVTNYIEDEDTVSHVRIGASKEDKVLIGILNKAQNQITKEELDLLKTKWFGVNRLIKDDKNISLKNEQMIYLKKKQKIKMCANPNWMPLVEIKDKQHIGIANDFMGIIKDKLGLSLELIQSSTLSDSLQKMRNKECDILSFGVQTPLRSRYLSETNPLMATKLAIITKRNMVYTQDIKSNLDQRYAYVKDSFIYEILKEKYPSIKLKEVSDIHGGLELVKNGEVFAYIDDPLSAMYEIKNNYLSQLSITGILEDEYSLSVLVRSDEKILRDILNKAIDTISIEEKQRIKNKWISYEAAYLVEKRYIVTISLISIVIILILSFQLYRYYKYKKIKEQNLEHEAKMVSMGEMLANISHQWKQPLNEINSLVMNIDLDYQKDKLDYESLDEYLLKIESLTKHMSQTITDFNMFISEDKEKKEFFISSSVDEVLRIVKNSLNSKGIKYINNIDEDLMIENFGNDFKQALLVIVQNSIDAIVENEIEDGFIEFSALIEDNDLIIEISDNAGGIPKKLLNRIFEPYFTTKEKATNIGIGLYFTYKIIKIHMNGNIIALNNEKNGMSFYIRIPFS